MGQAQRLARIRNSQLALATGRLAERNRGRRTLSHTSPVICLDEHQQHAAATEYAIRGTHPAGGQIARPGTRKLDSKENTMQQDIWRMWVWAV